jgi:hypothetical protein
MNRAEALDLLNNWDGLRQSQITRQISEEEKAERNRIFALQLWEQAQPITGTLAARYLSETRKIDLAALPGSIDEVLRFHPRCPFGPGNYHPCLIALMRDVSTDTPTGIHRIGLTTDAKKIDRFMLGRSGAVKLWPSGTQLVVGEGIETVLAAATRIPHEGTPLQPAWALLSATPLGQLPIITGVNQLILLVDHDDAGIAAANTAADRWSRAQRTVLQLMPDEPGFDFNDVVMAE